MLGSAETGRWALSDPITKYLFMINCLSANIETILFQRASAWNRITSTKSQLIDALVNFLKTLPKQTSSKSLIASNWSINKAANTAIWILDRLVPENQSEIFFDLGENQKNNNNQLLIYAWARRKSKEEFEDIFRESWINLEKSHKGVMNAWIDVVGTDNPENLLEWWELVSRAGTGISIKDDWFYTPLIIEAYSKRIKNNREKRHKLLEFVLSNTDKFNLLNPIHSICLKIIIQNIACEAPEYATGKPETDKKWFFFLYNTLEQLGYQDISKICKDACIPNEGYGSVLSYAKLLWIYCNYNNNLVGLLDNIDKIEELCPYESLSLMKRLVPKNKIGVWDMILDFPERGIFPMVAFCKWLKPSYRDSLFPYFGHYDIEIAACAYQAYLNKTPHAVVSFLWEINGNNLKLWQEIIMDRHLFAPKEIKPPSVMEDIQSVEYDMRLFDPLNIRRF